MAVMEIDFGSRNLRIWPLKEGFIRPSVFVGWINHRGAGGSVQSTCISDDIKVAIEAHGVNLQN